MNTDRGGWTRMFLSANLEKRGNRGEGRRERNVIVVTISIVICLCKRSEAISGSFAQGGLIVGGSRGRGGGGRWAKEERMSTNYTNGANVTNGAGGKNPCSQAATKVSQAH